MPGPPTEPDAVPKPDSPADRLAFVISALASPYLVIPAFIVVVAASVAESARQALSWAVVGGAGVVGVPLLYILVGVRRGQLTDIHVRLREQRRGPFLAALIGAACSALGLHAIGSPEALQLGAWATVINGLAFALVTRRWKISLHPAALTACVVLAGSTVAASWYWTLTALPAVIWARVRRRRHTWAQGLVASLLAALLTGLTVAGWRAAGGPTGVAR